MIPIVSLEGSQLTHFFPDVVLFVMSMIPCGGLEPGFSHRVVRFVMMIAPSSMIMSLCPLQMALLCLIDIIFLILVSVLKSTLELVLGLLSFLEHLSII